MVTSTPEAIRPYWQFRTETFGDIGLAVKSQKIENFNFFENKEEFVLKNDDIFDRNQILRFFK
jgi:hypothetical protein